MSARPAITPDQESCSKRNNRSPLKVLRQNKVIGLAIGERSLLAAELTAGDKPAARQLAEFVYPDGVSTQNPDALGKALGEFLSANGFTAKTAVVGLPARW